jgi:hypothetical protein
MKILKLFVILSVLLTSSISFAIDDDVHYNQWGSWDKMIAPKAGLLVIHDYQFNYDNPVNQRPIPVKPIQPTVCEFKCNINPSDPCKIKVMKMINCIKQMKPECRRKYQPNP